MGAGHRPSLGHTGDVQTAEPIGASPLRLLIFGRRFDLEFRGLSPEIVARLHELWEWAVVTEPDLHDRPCVLTVAAAASDLPAHELGASDGLIRPDVFVVGNDPQRVPYTVSRTVTAQAIMRRRGEALMLHAVGLSGPDGRTVALVAPSGTGKTTAASVLGRHLGYVSDETVVVEGDGSISAYAKPLSLALDPQAAYDKQERSPRAAGLLPTPAAPYLGALVVLRRDTSRSAPQLSLLNLVDAILDVIPETSALPSLTHPLDRLCRMLTVGGGPFRLDYAEIGSCVDQVVALAQGTVAAPPTPTWVHYPGPDGDNAHLPSGPGTDAATGPSSGGLPTSQHEPLTWDSRVCRSGWLDAIVSDGEAVVLRALVPVRLSRLGTTVWLEARHPASLAHLHARVVAELGDYPHSENLVLEAVQHLLDADVLTRC